MRNSYDEVRIRLAVFRGQRFWSNLKRKSAHKIKASKINKLNIFSKSSGFEV
jgi:hypothetical protein